MLDRLHLAAATDDVENSAEDRMSFDGYWLATELVHMGLAERLDGDFGRIFYRLTEKGRKVREEGAA